MALPAFLATWCVAMAAMMLPSELPLFRLDYATARSGVRDGLGGAFRMGVVNGVWCVGCCIGLTAALLALGMMTAAWMVVVALVIFVEKTTRAGILASRAGAAALAVGAVAWAT